MQLRSGKNTGAIVFKCTHQRACMSVPTAAAKSSPITHDYTFSTGKPITNDRRNKYSQKTR